MYRPTRILTLLISTMLLLATGSRPSAATVQASALQQDAPPTVTTERIEWRIGAPHHGGSLTIGGPGGFTAQQSFGADELPALEVTSIGGTLPDGVYTYQLILSPTAPAAGPTLENNGRDAPGSTTGPTTGTAAEGTVHSGTFAILDGKFVIPVEEPSPTPSPETAIAPEDQVIDDDLIVRNNLCVGFDCANNMNFGLDTIVLAENNLRIFFDDTSTANFPDRDWRIVVNENASAGLEKFSIHDATAGRTPFTIVGNAPADSLFVSAEGRLGLKTNAPALELHIADGDSPALRLEQTSAGGFGTHTWDIAGNEANFFVRDLTGGNRLPFRIRPGAPTSSIDIRANGNVGIGLANAEAPLHIQRSDGSARLLIKETNPTNTQRVLLELENNGPARIALKNSPTNTWVMGTNNILFYINRLGASPTRFRLDNNGNLILSGSLTQNAATALQTENVPGDVLPKLANVPIVAWEDNMQLGEDEAEENGENGDTQQTTVTVRHISPDAAGFHAAFALGIDGSSIAPLDVATVALAAAQELDAISKEQAAQIAALQAENAELRARLAAIETALGIEPAELPSEPSKPPSTSPDEPTSSAYVPLIQQ